MEKSKFDIIRIKKVYLVLILMTMFSCSKSEEILKAEFDKCYNEFEQVSVQLKAVKRNIEELTGESFDDKLKLDPDLEEYNLLYPQEMKQYYLLSERYGKLVVNFYKLNYMLEKFDQKRTLKE